MPDVSSVKLQEVCIRVAKKLTITSDAFSQAFAEAQEIHNISAPHDFDALVRGKKGQDAFEYALLVAAATGWLELLLTALMKQQQDIFDDLIELKAEKDPGNATLQAMITPTEGFHNIETLRRGYQNASLWTVKVIVKKNGKLAEGTGVLIGQNVILTSWHNVRFLFTRDNHGKYVADVLTATEVEAGILRVEFDNIYALSGAPIVGFAVPVKPNWCLAFSPCVPDELDERGSRLSRATAGLESNLDFALIHLAAAPGLERKPYLLDRYSPATCHLPQCDEPLVITQHPAGAPMQVHLNKVAKAWGVDEPSATDARFFHYVNTLPGSSGAPCFNKEFDLVGIHQGTFTPQSGAEINRGIPLRHVLPLLPQPFPKPEPSDVRLWHLGSDDRYNVAIGTDEFQQMVWDEIAVGTATRPGVASTRILTITGAPKSGKSFLTRILLTQLRRIPEEHLIVPLNTNSIPGKKRIGDLTSRQIANLLVQIVNPGGEPLPDMPPDAVDSTLSKWIRDVLVDEVLRRLDKARKLPFGRERLVWIILPELNATEIENTATSEFASDFLYTLYAAVAQFDWLRVVLDGFEGDPPPEVDSLLRDWHVESDPTKASCFINISTLEALYRRVQAALGNSLDRQAASLWAASQLAVFEYLWDLPEIKEAHLMHFSKLMRHEWDKIAQQKCERLNWARLITGGAF